jgi:hypothetical protein
MEWQDGQNNSNIPAAHVRCLSKASAAAFLSDGSEIEMQQPCGLVLCDLAGRSERPPGQLVVANG